MTAFHYRLFFSVAALVLVTGACLPIASCGQTLSDADRLGSSEDPKDLEKAAEIYRDELDKMLKLYNNNVAVRAKLGRRLMELEDFGAAYKHLEYAAQIRLTDPDIAMDMAICMANLIPAAKFTVAQVAEQYEKVLRIDPTRAEAYHGLSSLAYTHKKDLDESWEYCQKALKADPNYIPAHILAARLLVEKGNLLRAGHHYKVVLDLDPRKTARNSDLAKSYAAVLRALGREEEANRVLDKFSSR